MKCLSCQEEFESNRKDSKFCSAKCRLLYYRKAKTHKSLSKANLSVSKRSETGRLKPEANLQVSDAKEKDIVEEEPLDNVKVALMTDQIYKLMIKRAIQAGKLPLGTPGDVKLFGNRKASTPQELAEIISSAVPADTSLTNERATLFVLGG